MRKQLQIPAVLLRHQSRKGKSAYARLPKLVIKKFGGQDCNGIEFWDTFKSAVHNNEDLSDIERFSYLRTLLEGPAYSTVAGLALTSANYEKAVDLLKQRFGQKQVIL